MEIDKSRLDPPSLFVFVGGRVKIQAKAKLSWEREEFFLKSRCGHFPSGYNTSNGNH
jgi:hypothetical protein